MTYRNSDLSIDQEIRQTQERLSIYEAISAALRDPHGVLDAVLGSADAETARLALGERFGFDEVQATAVMDMQFRRATAIDKERIEEEREQLVRQLHSLETERDVQ
jgi:DNA gyrase subunit A